MVIWVSKKEMDNFLPLIPGEMKRDVESGRYFCLGTICEEDQAAAGVLVFSQGGRTLVNGEPTVMIEAHWIYVLEKYRKRGYANKMMEELAEVLWDNPAVGIVVDVPFGSEYDLAEAFFSSWGFVFQVADNGQMIITKEDCRREMDNLDKDKAAKLKGGSKKRDGLISVIDLPDIVFTEAIREMRHIEKSGIFDDLPENKTYYYPDMSFAAVDNGHVTSMVLFEQTLSDELCLVMLKSILTSPAKELFLLLRTVFSEYYQSCPEEMTVRLPLKKEESRKLANRLFPDVDTVIVRRGYFS